ncbi:hypothetical protein [Paenibacillus thiaminolyticus]|uniref:hypothetical protein n=1 Tax=Paenibacillus thiaminolyticus TaxID=49283 RepID=UPI0037C59C50
MLQLAKQPAHRAASFLLPLRQPGADKSHMAMGEQEQRRIEGFGHGRFHLQAQPGEVLLMEGLLLLLQAAVDRERDAHILRLLDKRIVA